jgi:hypothetical protein
MVPKDDLDTDEEWTDDDAASDADASEPDDIDPDELDDELEIDAIDIAVVASDDSDDVADDDDDDDDDDDEALDELEAEELDMLTDDEAAETLPIDEVAEIRKLRREAIELDSLAESIGEDEFVCNNCFLVKRISQLADKRKKLCSDCV